MVEIRLNTGLFRTAHELLQGKTQNKVNIVLIRTEFEAVPYPYQPCQVQFLLSGADKLVSLPWHSTS